MNNAKQMNVLQCRHQLLQIHANLGLRQLVLPDDVIQKPLTNNTARKTKGGCGYRYHGKRPRAMGGCGRWGLTFQ